MTTIRNIIYSDNLNGIIPDANELNELQKDFEQPLNQVHQELNNLGLLVDKYKSKYVHSNYMFILFYIIYIINKYIIFFY